MIIDFGDLKQITGRVLEKLDHAFLNEIPPFDKIEPSAENLAAHIFDQIASQLAGEQAKVEAQQDAVKSLDAPAPEQWSGNLTATQPRSNSTEEKNPGNSEGYRGQTGAGKGI